MKPQKQSTFAKGFESMKKWVIFSKIKEDNNRQLPCYIKEVEDSENPNDEDFGFEGFFCEVYRSKEKALRDFEKRVRYNLSNSEIHEKFWNMQHQYQNIAPLVEENQAIKQKDEQIKCLFELLDQLITDRAEMVLETLTEKHVQEMMKNE